MKSINLTDCTFEHEDIDAKYRILPLGKKMSINIALTSNLFKEKELVVLQLLQSTYLANLKKFGKDLRDIKELIIEHAGDNDINIFRATEHLDDSYDTSPEFVG